MSEPRPNEHKSISMDIRSMHGYTHRLNCSLSLFVLHGLSPSSNIGDDPEEVGYMRGEWRRIGAVMNSPAMRAGGERAAKWYENIEALRKDKEVYKAVRATIGAAHVEDGITIWDIMRETEEQKRRGRIGYMGRGGATG